MQKFSKGVNMFSLDKGVCLMVLAVMLVTTPTQSKPRSESSDQVSDLEKKLEDMERKMSLLTKQVMMQQSEFEERIRSDGQSGLKQNRVLVGGTRPYFYDSTTGDRHAAIHDHANHIRTIGMGEVVAVLNGIEFKTRHNDYKLRMPSTTQTKFRKMEDVPFPDVPPEVLSKSTVDEQIEEMRAWFKAWKDSDHSTRDYRKYFKPVLCYLEGYWKNTDNTGKVEEPFQSDRHYIDASTWHELLRRNSFSAYSGRKDAGENLAFLPTKIVDYVNDTIPVYAQWNYRIACHPLKHQVPLYGFRMIDDFNARMRRRAKREGFSGTRAARFQLNPNLRGDINRRTWNKYELLTFLDYLDVLMEEVPGLDNYSANLTDTTYGEPAYHFWTINENRKQQGPLNTGFYHRWYKEFVLGAMGTNMRRRGFSDPSVFMSMTSHPQIAPMSVETCNKVNGQKVCKTYSQRWTYAIPLEIIYTTPLSKWNPYNIEYKGLINTPYANTVRHWQRNGVKTKAKAFNGTNSNTYYMTPVEFFSTTQNKEQDSADTGTKSHGVGVLDRNGTVRSVVASGHNIILPHIPGVGKIRQRWPIAPLHGEGSGIWKQMDALKDVLMQWNTYQDLLPEHFKFFCN
ncbi:uncharacterized protein LOC135499028 [Lineus longissimus]|uniref:uncharacterized protein LOC135499028 n=1 Tax=Lineus longissimus TaxID=88925 RepID=UPI00315D4AC2